jgi:hypothetical protein
MGKGREPQIVLKTDERNFVLELGGRGKFVVKPSSWDEKRSFSRTTSPRSRSRTAAG